MGNTQQLGSRGACSGAEWAKLQRCLMQGSIVSLPRRTVCQNGGKTGGTGENGEARQTESGGVHGFALLRTAPKALPTARPMGPGGELGGSSWSGTNFKKQNGVLQGNAKEYKGKARSCIVGQLLVHDRGCDSIHSEAQFANVVGRRQCTLQHSPGHTIITE